VNDAVRELFVRGARAFEARDDAGATAAFQEIVDRPDVADDDKAMACTNLAAVCDRTNDVDQALTWYDRARALAVDRLQLVEEKRATYLASKARFAEASDILTRLLQAPDLEPDNRLRLEVSLAEARRGRYSPPVNDAVRELFFRGAQAFEAGDDAGATAAFQEIVNRADVADDDKAMACVNLATVCDRTNDVERALTWYRRAVAFAVDRLQIVEESRATYLASRARYAEAGDILTRLLGATNLEPADRVRLEHNLAEVQGRLFE
jgi:tetratricopeptide (TPR) repeat protein